MVAKKNSSGVAANTKREGKESEWSSCVSLAHIHAYLGLNAGDYATLRKFKYFLKNPTYGCDAINGAALPTSFTRVCDYLPAKGSDGTLLIIISAILAAVSLLMGISFIYFRDKLIMKLGLPLSMFFNALGAALLALSSIAFVGPNTEIWCMIRPILFNLPISLMISAMFAKVYRLWRIVENKKLAARKHSDCTLILQIMSIVFFDLAVHIIRILTSAPFSQATIEKV